VELGRDAKLFGLYGLGRLLHWSESKCSLFLILMMDGRFRLWRHSSQGSNPDAPFAKFELLDRLVANLADEDWKRLVPRSETKDPWTVKDALAHLTHWKADVARSVRRQPIPTEERGLNIGDGNRLVYRRWHDRLSARGFDLALPGSGGCAPRPARSARKMVQWPGASRRMALLISTVTRPIIASKDIEQALKRLEK